MLTSVFAIALGWALPLGGFALLAGAVASFFYLPMFGKQVAAGLIAASAATFAYDFGYAERASLDHSAALASQIVTLKADVAEYQRQAQAAAKIADDAKAAQRNAENQAAQNQEKVDEYAAELAKRATPACDLTDVDVGRLRGIGAAKSAYPPEPPARPADLRPSGSGSEAK